MAEHGEVAEGWHKSSRSETSSCVEVNIGADQVRVRHSQNQRGPMLSFTHAEWRAFLDGVRLGEFELPASCAP